MTSILRNASSLILCLLLFSSGALAGVPFPQVDPNKLVISLQRTACYGSCPDYRVDIKGDGTVTFTTRPWVEADASAVHRMFSRSSGVRVPGTHQTKIDAAKVVSLLDQFKSMQFFELKDVYRSGVTDNPTYMVSIATGFGKKQVVDYVGKEVGMPAAMTALENAIDDAAGSKRWIEGTAEVIPLLQAEGARFDGVIGIELMDAAAARGDVATMEKLLALGASLRVEDGPDPVNSAIREGKSSGLEWLIAKGALPTELSQANALMTAVDEDNHEAIELLMPDGSQPPLDRELATNLLKRAAANADVRLVARMLALGADPNGPPPRSVTDDPPLFLAAKQLWGPENHAVAERRAVVKKLLDAGAKPTSCLRNVCESPLFLVSDPVIAEMLIVAGADPNFRDFDGEHILFGISDEDVALVLLAHGADRNAIRPADKMTLKDWARYQKWPRVLALLKK